MQAVLDEDRWLISPGKLCEEKLQQYLVEDKDAIRHTVQAPLPPAACIESGSPSNSWVPIPSRSNLALRLLPIKLPSVNAHHALVQADLTCQGEQAAHTTPKLQQMPCSDVHQDAQRHAQLPAWLPAA